MDIIKNNPYRIIGILVGTSTKDEHSKSKKLKMYIEAGQDVPEDFSFPIIGSLERDLNKVNDAISKLNLNSDRVNTSIFWFYNGNAITDEPVFEALKGSKDEAKEAIKVWRKLVESGEVTKRNASAFQNLSTFNLNIAVKNIYVVHKNPNYFDKIELYKKNLENAIVLKLKFLDSDFINDYIKLSSDETYKVSKESLQIHFLTQVYFEIEKVNDNLVFWYIEFLSKISFTAKQNFLSDLVLKQIDKINTKIEETKTKRKENPSNGYNLGLSLFENENQKISTFQNILGKSNIKFTSISDKLSDEILQCGIVYFKKYRDTNTDPSAKAMDLFKKAKKMAIGSIAIQRCQENTENLQEWIDEKPERDKMNKIQIHLDALLKIFDEFENKIENIANAKILVNSAKPHLINIKNVLGNTDELYLRLSTRVAGQAQSYIIEEVNNVQENLDYKLSVDRYGTLNKIKAAFRNGWEVTNLIGTLDMEYEYKTSRFNPNKETLRGLCNQIDISTTSYSTSSPSSSSRPSTSPRPSSTYTPPKSGSNDTNWGGWIFGIILFIIIIKSCSAANENYNNDSANYDTAVDTTAVVADTTAVVADTTAFPIDSSASIPPEENYSSPYIGNQLENGASPLDDCFGSGDYNGNATLTIKNGGNADAIVCLYSISNDRTIRNEYIQKNSTFKMSNIAQGYYKIRIFYGNDWNPNLVNNCGSKGNFESDVNFSEFDGEEYFEDSSRGFTNATVTLYTVANGNASSSTIDQSTFFNK